MFETDAKKVANNIVVILEKTISKKVKKRNQFDGACPTCNELLIMGRQKYKYCGKCGQKLDWD